MALVMGRGLQDLIINRPAGSNGVGVNRLIIDLRYPRDEAKLRKLGDAPRPVAANDGGVLPADLLYDVLLRLPADELCRLRLVCRRWRAITSDPLFAKAHRSRHSYLIGLHNASREVHVLVLSGNIMKRIRLHKHHLSCFSFHAQHDLVCVNVSWGQSCVLNLATGAVIADLPSQHEHTAQPSRFVLGHVPTTGAYKVLRLYSTKSQVSTGQSCDVVTLGRRIRWRARPDAPVRVVVRPDVCTTVIRAVAYFLVMMNGENSKPDSIASFDFAMEEWRPRMIQGPLSSLDPMTKEKLRYNLLDWNDFMLTGVNDCLVFMHNNYNDYSTADLWFMEDMTKDMSSTRRWTKRYSVGPEPHWGCPGLRFFCPLVVSDDGMIIFRIKSTTLLKAYDLKTSMWAGVNIRIHYASLAMHHGSLLQPCPLRRDFRR